MRKKVEWLGLFLIASFLSVFSLQAENIRQDFNTQLGPSYYNDGTQDGWTYQNFQTETYAPNVFAGGRSAAMQAGSGTSAKIGFLTTPEKTGGVGLVSFWAKMKSSITNTKLPLVHVEVQTSEDGETFTTAETIKITSNNTTVYNRYTAVINKANAKYVRIHLPRTKEYEPEVDTYVYINIDELIVTDNGKSADATVTLSSLISSEVNVESTASVQVKGTGVTDNVTFKMHNANSAFTFPSATATATQVNAGYALPIKFKPTQKHITRDTLIVQLNGQPDLIFPILGYGLLPMIAEDFNSTTIPSYNGTFDYEGWAVANGHRSTSNMHEGAGCLSIYGSVVSPEKVKGIGEIGFWYRPKDTNAVTFSVSTSVDGSTWVEQDKITTTSVDYVYYHKSLNLADGKFVKVESSHNASTHNLLIDEFVITENSKTIAKASLQPIIQSCLTTPYTFDVNISFTNIAEDVLFTIGDPQISLAKTSITKTEATGTYVLKMTYTPDAGKGFVSTTFTVSGGGLSFPVQVPVTIHKEQESLFSNFDATWGGSSAGNYLTDAGWQVISGSRNTSGVIFGGGADVRLTSSSGGESALITPPLSSGVGSIQFYMKNTTSNIASVKIETSINGSTWVEKEAFEYVSTPYSVHELVINDATAKYVKVSSKGTAYSTYLYIDNFTVTKNGVGLTKVSLTAQPVFETADGSTQTVQVSIAGQNITSDLNIALKNGTTFSLGELTTIPMADINNKTYTFPITFSPETDVYFTDEIIISGPSFSFDQTMPISGYNVKDLLFQGAESIFSQLDEGGYMVDGWKTSGSRSTYAANVRSGSAALQLLASSSAHGYLITPPKSNGVGIIQFYYKNYGGTKSANIKVRTYETLGGEPTEIDALVSESDSYVLYSKVVNDAKAKYVEIILDKPETTSIYTIFDDVVVTANGKIIPQVSVPAKIDMAGYKGEDETTSFDITAEGIDGDITLRLEKEEETAFSIDTTKITPEEGEVEQSINITYTPDADGKYSTNVIIVEGKGMLQPLRIPVAGSVRVHSLSQNFEATGWGPSEGTHILEGWLLENAYRNSMPPYSAGMAGASLNMRVSANKEAKVTSPAKTPGIKDISFITCASGGATSPSYTVETSADGKTWKKIVTDGEITATGMNTATPINIEVNDPKACYVRISTKANMQYDISIYLDNISITGMPYLRQVGTVEPVETTEVPVTVPVKIAGMLDADAAISMLVEESSYTLAKTAITPEDVADDATYTLELEFSANASGTYTDAVNFTIAEGNIVIVPVSVVYNKPSYIDLAEAIEPIVTEEVPVTIPVSVIGYTEQDVTVTIEGEKAANFTFEKTTITPEEIIAGIAFDVSFTAPRSGVYTAEVVIADSDNEYQRIPLSVTYNTTSYVVQLGEIEPIDTNVAPMTISVSVGGYIEEDVTISLTGDTDNFTVAKTTITPEELKAGIELDAVFNATESGKYTAKIHFADDKKEYLAIDLEVNYVATYIELANPLNPVKTDKAPVVIPIDLKGLLIEKATIALEGDDSSYFSCIENEITPEQVDGKTHRINVSFNSFETKEYKVDVVVSGADKTEYIRIPLVVDYTSLLTNGEQLLKFIDFERNEEFLDWKMYDLDGKSLSFIYNTPKAWYWFYEPNEENPDSNSVMAATSMFSSNSPDHITPANDWLFTSPLAIPATGSYGVSWDARSMSPEWLETYEMRVIEESVLTKLEEGFTDTTPLAEISNTLIANSQFIFAVDKENGEWTTRSFNLDSYRGKTVRVIWRHMSAEQKTLFIDNFRFYSEILGSFIASAPEVIYTQIPEFVAKNNIAPEVEVTVNNGGTESLSNVSVTVTVNNLKDQVVYKKEEKIASMSANQPTTIKTDNNFSVFADDYYYKVEVKAADYTSTILSQTNAGFELTEHTYALDNGDILGGVYSDSQGFKLGQKFPIDVLSYLGSVTFALTESTTSNSVNIILYELDANGQMKEINTQSGFAVTPGTEKVYTMKYPERIELSAGKTYFVAFEPKNGEYLYLAKTSNPVGSIAAFYTTNNGEWTWLMEDHTLYIRLEAYATSVGMDQVIASDVNAYANPDGTLQVINAKAGDTVTVFDVQGKAMFNDKIQTNNDRFAPSVANGVYIVKVGNDSFKVIF